MTEQPALEPTERSRTASGACSNAIVRSSIVWPVATIVIVWRELPSR